MSVNLCFLVLSDYEFLWQNFVGISILVICFFIFQPQIVLHVYTSFPYFFFFLILQFLWCTLWAQVNKSRGWKSVKKEMEIWVGSACCWDVKGQVGWNRRVFHKSMSPFFELCYICFSVLCKKALERISFAFFYLL